MEISGCEAFRLGWEQAMTEPSSCLFCGPDEYDALNKIEGHNYDLDFYVRKENLRVTFAEKLKKKQNLREQILKFWGLNFQITGRRIS